MKRIYFALPLAFLLGGCLSGRVVDRATTPESRTEKDEIHAVNSAVTTDDFHLLVFVEATLGGNRKPGDYMIDVDLTRAMPEAADSSSAVLPRSVLVNGWDASLLKDRKTRPVEIHTVGQDPEGGFDEARFHANPPAADTLVAVDRGDRWDFHFARAATGSAKANTLEFALEPVHTFHRNPGRLLLLPLTLPFDVATLPAQVVVYEMERK